MVIEHHMIFPCFFFSKLAVFVFSILFVLETFFRDLLCCVALCFLVTVDALLCEEPQFWYLFVFFVLITCIWNSFWKIFYDNCFHRRRTLVQGMAWELFNVVYGSYINSALMIHILVDGVYHVQLNFFNCIKPLSHHKKTTNRAICDIICLLFCFICVVCSC